MPRLLAALPVTGGTAVATTAGRYLQQGQRSSSGTMSAVNGSMNEGIAHAANARQTVIPSTLPECLELRFTRPRLGLPSLLPMGALSELSPNRRAGMGKRVRSMAPGPDRTVVHDADRTDPGVVNMAHQRRHLNPFHE